LNVNFLFDIIKDAIIRRLIMVSSVGSTDNSQLNQLLISNFTSSMVDEENKQQQNAEQANQATQELDNS
jgi:hypothetical protein